jgi:hypothetical protein
LAIALLAELELFHSRPIAPTRRLALGHRLLPTDPSPGPGSILLGGIAARYGPVLDGDVEDDEIDLLMAQVEAGMRIVQPRLRHRLQVDRVGLLRSDLRLVADRAGPSFQFSTQGSALVCLLGAIYAAGTLAPTTRHDAFRAIRKGLRWRGPLDDRLVGHLTGRAEGAGWVLSSLDPIAWSLEVLGFAAGDGRPSKSQVRSRFRECLRLAHPDHGGAEVAAAERIAELSEARRILLGS